MATTATKKPARKRLGLTRVQARQIRKWRRELGNEMWSVNDAMYDLKLKYREQDRPWTVAEITRASRLAEILLRKVLSVRKSVASFLAKKELAVQYRTRLKESVDFMKTTAGLLQKLIPRNVRERIPVWEREDEEKIFITTFNSAMKNLRYSWDQLFFTTQEDVRRFKFSEDEDFLWHSSIQRTSSPPRQMIKEFDAMAENQGVTVHVYDQENELVYVAKPTWEFGGIAEKAALKQSKKARQQWNHIYRNKVPATVTEFKQALTPAQKREVTKFLKDHPNETFTLSKVAGELDITITALDKEAAPSVSAYSEFVENPGVDDVSIADVFRDSGLHHAIWEMDLED